MAEVCALDELTGFGLATVMARKTVDAAAVGERLGVEAPDGPFWRQGEGIALLGTGRGTWLAYAEQAAPDWAATLQGRLGPLASVSDQSSGYRMFRLSGSGARGLLQRGAAIDFHPASFGPGSVATTVIAHIGVIVWRLADEDPVYHLAVFRSLAGSFRHWYDANAGVL